MESQEEDDYQLPIFLELDVLGAKLELESGLVILSCPFRMISLFHSRILYR